jgi:hypothetical protein
MPVRDLRNNIRADLLAFGEITGSGITPGQIIDTVPYNSGIMFSLAAPIYADGEYSAFIEESDDPGMSDADTITDGDPRLIGSTFDTKLTSQTNVGDKLGTLGVVGTKRYVQVSIVAAGVSSGATIVFISNLKPDILAVT